MRQLVFAALSLAFLCSCAAPPPMPSASTDPCAVGEATYACQVIRYRDAT